MAEAMTTLLDRLHARISELVARNESLRRRNAELESLNADLLRQADEARQESHRSRLDAEYLAVSHKLADNPDNLIVTRRRIARLIRNIDRCLEMLKE